MKTDSLASGILSQLNTPRHSQKKVQRELNLTDLAKFSNSDLWQQHCCTTGRNSFGLSDRESVCSASTSRSKRIRSRNFSMKPLKGGGINKKSKTMDYTNYAYNEAVGRLKLMLADSYSPTKTATSSYLRSINDDSADNYSDNMSVIDRPIFSDISKYLSPSQKNRLGGAGTSSNYRSKRPLGGFSASKENLTTPTIYKTTTLPTTALTSTTTAVDYYGASAKPQVGPPTDSVQAPVEIFNFIEKQEDYIEQLEKESKYCRNELTNLLGKVKDVINENEQLTEHARSELVSLSKGVVDKSTTSPSSDSDEHLYCKSKSPISRKKDVKSPRYASAPNIVYEARISELEAELMQANIDLKRVKTENDDLKKKLARTDPSLALVSVSNTAQNCDAHRKQIDLLQKDKSTLEETIRHLQKSLDEAKSQQYSQSSKRYINDLVQMERSQAELEVRHLRDELDRQHERVREMQHEMARRLADERANAERRYNNQVDQLGGDLSSQWEQVAKLQLDLERQKRFESDMKRDLTNRNSQIEELKMELRANRSTFLADMAQVNAEKQSLEQEITALRLQLDRASRDNKTEASQLNAEINSLRQRLDRADADLLHSKREVLRLNDEIANLEKELAYGEMKNEIRPTKKDLDKRISEMQDKHEMQLTLPPPRTPTPLQSERSREETGAVAVPETPKSPVANVSREEEDLMEIPIARPLQMKEKENMYTSRFDDENIWQNISRSIERLDLDWAKMPPLPKLTPAATVITAATPPPSPTHPTKCHCQKFRISNYSRKDNKDFCKCKASNSATAAPRTAAHLKDFSKYGNPVTTTTTYSKHHKTSTHNSKTVIPQPLKPTGADYLFHHQHNYKHDFTLDMHPSYRCSHSADTHLDTDNLVHNSATTQTHKVETTTSTNTEELYHNRDKQTPTPRRKCHNHNHSHSHNHHHHSHRSHSRCHSHERGITAAAATGASNTNSDASKTEPLTWLQQHLVLKHTIKACHKCQNTGHANVTVESDSQRSHTAERDVHLTTCCHTQHIIRACCDNKECLKDLIPPAKEEQDKGTNTETFKEKEKKQQKPVKVDINVRLVPKPPRTQEESKEKVVEDIQPADNNEFQTPSADDSELYLDLENFDIESTQL